MPIFNYKGLDKTGREMKSQITSESEAMAKSKLKSQGIMLLEIKEQKSGVAGKSSAQPLFGGGLKIEELAMMTRQLATLLRAKIQIVDSFSALIDQTDHPKLKVILAEVRQKVNEGSSLGKALSDYPKVFDNVYVNMVEAGEASGTLDVVLLRLADFTEAQVKLKNKIKGAMTYPLIMVVIGSGMMSFIFMFVIPKITKIFITMKKELPLPTKISIFISNFMSSYWWAVIIGGFLSWVLFKKYIASKKGKERWHRFLLRTPLVGPLVTMINVSRFCSTLATLLNSGVPILVAMRIVKNLIGNVHMQSAVDQARTSVAEGASIAGPLVQSGHFPAMVTHMISLGEKSGELEPMLRIVAENYEDQVDSRLNGLTATLEPVMMIFMGLAVGFIVFSVIMPMMDMNQIK